MNSIRSRYVWANGVRTHYSESGGSDRPLVALHGGGNGSSGWAGMGRLLELLQDEYWCLALDSVGGYGKTDPYAPVPYGLQSRVDHLASVVDALCLERFTLMGNSQGAWCAARYAITHPDRVERLVLIGSGTISSAMGLKPPPTDAALAMRAYDGTRDAMRRLLEGLVYDHSKLTDELIDARQAAATRPGAREAFETASRANQRLREDPAMAGIFDMQQSLPAITRAIPTMVVWGEQDGFAVPELGRELEAKLPDARFEWVPNAGHQVQTDQPEMVAEIITAFGRR